MINKERKSLMFPMFYTHHCVNPKEGCSETETMTVPRWLGGNDIEWSGEIVVPFYHGDTAYITIRNLSLTQPLPANIKFMHPNFDTWHTIKILVKPKEIIDEKIYVSWDEPPYTGKPKPTFIAVKLTCEEGNRKCKGFVRLSKYEEAF